MTKILAVASNKGGEGKTTEAVHLSVAAARRFGLDVLLADADGNESAYDYAMRGNEETMPFTIAKAGGEQAAHLARLRRGRRRDLTIVDLPGARGGEFEAMLKGEEARPVADLLLVPIQPWLMNMKPVTRVLRSDIQPLGIPYLVVFTMVPTEDIGRYSADGTFHPGAATERRDELRELGFPVADVMIRDYKVYLHAYEATPGRTVYDMGGKRSVARNAEYDQDQLTDQVLGLLGFKPKQPARTTERITEEPKETNHG